MSEEEDMESPPTSKEEEIYAMLFKECDASNSGWVSVDTLVSTIRGMLHSSPKKGEDVYDSEENSHEAQYNLELLKCMLDNHSINGETNENTYNHVIRNWVKDLRGRSESPSSFKSPNISINSNEEERESHDGIATALFQESFETTGGGSSHHEIDEAQVITELRSENKKLTDMNQHLKQQIQLAEDATQQLQADNNEKTTKIRSQQQSMGVLESVKEEKEEILQKLIEEEKAKELLKQNIDNLNSEINDLNSEIAHLQNEVLLSQAEKDKAMEESATLKQALNQKEETLLKLQNEKFLLEASLAEQNEETLSLRHLLSRTKETVEELQSENSSLHTQLKEPVSSTPFRPQAPSLREELAENGICAGLSPVGFINVSSDHIGDSLLVEDKEEEKEEEEEEVKDQFSSLSAKLTESRVKFAQKATLMKQQLSDLIDTPLTSSLGSERSRLRDSFVSNKENEEVFETKLQRLENEKRSKKQRSQKLEKELRNLRKENEVLKERCDHLQAEVQKQGPGVVTESVEGQPSDIHLLLTSVPSNHEGMGTAGSHEGMGTAGPVPHTVYTPVSTVKGVIEVAAVSVQTDAHQLIDKATGGNESHAHLEATPTNAADSKGESKRPTVSEYQSLQTEVAQLREQPHTARHELGSSSPLPLPPPPASSLHARPLEESIIRPDGHQEEVEENQEVHEEIIPLLLTPAAQEESRLESILYQRRVDTPDITNDESSLQNKSSSIVQSRKSSGSCLSSFFTFIYQTLKTSVWLLVLILIILILLLVIIEVNTSIGRCSKGRMCSRSPLRLFLGQNLEYTHLGEVPT